MEARQAYNDHNLDAAIDAAEQALNDPTRDDEARLVAARAYLERFREQATPDDLAFARNHLSKIAPRRLGDRERSEYIVGLGQALYYEEAPGAAAEVFGSLLERGDSLPPEARERVLDWWATAVDRLARPRLDLERRMIYQRVRDRMREELGVSPSSSVAAYWLAAAAAGQSDWQAAWDSALSGWVRAPLAADHGAMLRADLDRLVRVAIAPERARALALPRESVLLQWEEFKEHWQRHQ